MNRRDFFCSGAAVAAVAGAVGNAAHGRAAARAGCRNIRGHQDRRRVARHPVADAAFNVLRKEGTEYPGTSPLLNEHRKGIFACAGCDLPVYLSETKFDSGTGWPSFWQEIAKRVGKTEDSSLGMTRTEVHCRRCGGHLGHVFDDGPPPTGMRHCINGVALTFKPATA